MFEERIDQEIEKSKELPQSLARTGSIGLTRTEMAKKIGKLFIERNNVNLHTDILDQPEFFWEQDKYVVRWHFAELYLLRESFLLSSPSETLFIVVSCGGVVRCLP